MSTGEVGTDGPVRVTSRCERCTLGTAAQRVAPHTRGRGSCRNHARPPPSPAANVATWPQTPRSAATRKVKKRKNGNVASSPRAASCGKTDPLSAAGRCLCPPAHVPPPVGDGGAHCSRACGKRDHPPQEGGSAEAERHGTPPLPVS